MVNLSVPGKFSIIREGRLVNLKQQNTKFQVMSYTMQSLLLFF